MIDQINYLLIRFAQLIPKNDVNIPQVDYKPDTFKNVLNVVFAVMGAVSVLMIAIGGFKYVMSMGEPSAVKKAKDTILYAFIGLFVAILAVAIVNFASGKLGLL